MEKKRHSSYNIRSSIFDFLRGLILVVRNDLLLMAVAVIEINAGATNAAVAAAMPLSLVTAAIGNRCQLPGCHHV